VTGRESSWLFTRALTHALNATLKLAFIIALSIAMFAAFSANPREAAAHPGQIDHAKWSTDRASSTIHVGRVQLHYHPTLHREAAALAAEIPSWWSEIQTTLGREVDDTLTIHFVTHAGSVASLSGMPEWASGVANPARGEIIISRHHPDGRPTDLRGLTRHEMVHVALHRVVDGAAIPRWLNEGIADSVGDEVSASRLYALASTVFGAGIPPLDQLELQFRGDKAQVDGAYAASRDFVGYLRVRDGDGRAFRHMLAQIRAGRPVEDAVLVAYGVSLLDLESEWRGGLFGRMAWYPFLSAGGLPYVLLLPVTIYAYRRRKQMLAESWARLDREERQAGELWAH